eukprot:5673420-Prymnesium_polylepis.1
MLLHLFLYPHVIQLVASVVIAVGLLRRAHLFAEFLRAGNGTLPIRHEACVCVLEPRHLGADGLRGHTVCGVRTEASTHRRRRKAWDDTAHAARAARLLGARTPNSSTSERIRRGRVGPMEPARARRKTIS